MAKFYLVGGYVRDKLLGVESHDRDYSIEAESYDAMRQAILERGGEIFLENPEYFTIRANVPNMGACDYVLCRKDGAYTDGRRPDDVQMGTLTDDLARRDFTVNAMAFDEYANLIDPFGGQKDLDNKLLRTVGHTEDRFEEDALRMLRAIRFSITKNFKLDRPICCCLVDLHFVGLLKNVSKERIREELYKCFKHNTFNTMYALSTYHEVANAVFEDCEMWLKPTLEKR